MKYKTILFFNLLFICALALVLTLENTSLVDAKGVAKPVFSSPTKQKGDNSGPPPGSEKGEVDPANLNADTAVRDPETPGFFVFFFNEAIDEAVRVKIFSSGIPQDVPALSNPVSIPDSVVPTSSNSPYFFFAVWRQAVEGGVITHFKQPILINAPYQDFNLSGDQEARIRIWMYNPATQSWVKLGGQVDIFNNVVTGMLTSMTPYYENGSTLFALGFDDVPPLNQTVDEFGTTTISTALRDDFTLFVPAGSVEVGSHFEITPFSGVPTNDAFEFIGKPIYIAAYHVNYAAFSLPEKYAMSQFTKPVTIKFNPDELQNQSLDPDTITIVMFVDGQWVDVEDLGYTVTRDETGISVEANVLGIFSLAQSTP
ncbi:MAG: hypothetical protein KDJ52_32880 [Anaerolineae bacterium]|nr:hypothetical protein [Anaerolineae bacterium]